MPGSRASRVALPLFVASLLSLPTLALAQPSALAQAAPGSQGSRPADELDLAGYEAELDRCAATLKHPSEVSVLRKSVPRVWFVSTPQGQVNVTTVWLRRKLEQLDNENGTSPVLVNEIEARLKAMRKAAAELEAASDQPTSDEARERLNKILQQPEFAGEQGPSQFDLLKARISRWITEQLIRLLSWLHLGPAAGNAIAWTIVGLALLALCVWVFRSLVGRSRLEILPADVGADPTNARLWAQDALAAAERGDYREAVHCAYWAAIVHLETLGLLKRDRARTPRESLRLLDPHPSEQKLLREFTRLFELIWYGYRPASVVDWSNARAHLEKMGCLTPSTAATANS
jgi:DNA-binding TFAR19-related protein (PDSD5 family)